MAKEPELHSMRKSLKELAIDPGRCFFIFFKYQKGSFVGRNRTYFWWPSWLDPPPEDDSYTETDFSPAVVRAGEGGRDRTCTSWEGLSQV